MNKFKPGYIIDGQYKIVSIIGCGGMSYVYRAERLSDGEIIAVKVPLPEFAEKLSSSQRFKRAEKIGEIINHPNIVKVFGHEGQKSFPYMLMEYVNGPSLNKIITNKCPLPLSQMFKITVQICDALEFIHRKGIIHHDIKPDNIMLTKGDDVKILDFGLAYVEDLKEEVWADLISVGGTPIYMAPEQLRGINDARSDLYSLGIIMYEMATGKLPFRGDIMEVRNGHLNQVPVNPRVFNPQIPVVLEKVILKAMEKDPGKRYQNAFEMRFEIRRDIINLIYGRKAAKSSYYYQLLILILVSVLVITVIVIVYFSHIE